jgi:hypothetical protein
MFINVIVLSVSLYRILLLVCDSNNIKKIIEILYNIFITINYRIVIMYIISNI